VIFLFPGVNKRQMELAMRKMGIQQQELDAVEVIIRLKDKEIVILDHHKVENNERDTIIHVNPHFFGIDGSKEVSGAGVVFLFWLLLTIVLHVS